MKLWLVDPVDGHGYDEYRMFCVLAETEDAAKQMVCEQHKPSYIKYDRLEATEVNLNEAQIVLSDYHDG